MVPEQQHGELERMSKRKRDRRLAQLPYTPAEAYRLTPEQAILLQAKLAELAAVKQQESAKQQQEVVLQDDIEDIEQKVLQQLSLMKKLRSPGGRPPVPAGSPNDMVRSPFLAPASRKRKRQVEPKRSIICRSCGQDQIASVKFGDYLSGCPNCGSCGEFIYRANGGGAPLLDGHQW